MRISQHSCLFVDIMHALASSRINPDAPPALAAIRGIDRPFPSCAGKACMFVFYLLSVCFLSTWGMAWQNFHRLLFQLDGAKSRGKGSTLFGASRIWTRAHTWLTTQKSLVLLVFGKSHCDIQRPFSTLVQRSKRAMHILLRRWMFFSWPTSHADQPSRNMESTTLRFVECAALAPSAVPGHRPLSNDCSIPNPFQSRAVEVTQGHFLERSASRFGMAFDCPYK